MQSTGGGTEGHIKRLGEGGGPPVKGKRDWTGYSGKTTGKKIGAQKTLRRESGDEKGRSVGGVRKTGKTNYRGLIKKASGRGGESSNQNNQNKEGRSCAAGSPKGGQIKGKERD